MSNARKLADNLPTEGSLSGRNIIINGGMTIAQRGNSFSGTTSLVHLLDRWHTPVGGSFNFDTTITQSTTVPTGEGFKYSLKVEADTVQTPSGGANAGIGTKLEGQDLQHLSFGTSSAKSLTLSFWVRSNKTGIYCIQLTTTRDVSGGGYYSHIKEYTISSANTWEKKVLTFPAHTAQGIRNANTEGLRVLWWLATGSDDHVAADTWMERQFYGSTSNQVNFMDNASNEWYLTGCQMEIGPQSTPFEHEPVGVTLSKCKRYFHTYGGTNAFEHLPFLGQADGTSINFNHELPVEMRAPPSLTQSGDWRVNHYYLGGYYTLSNVALDNLSAKLVRGSATISGNMSSAIGRIIAYNDINARWSYSAEL